MTVLQARREPESRQTNHTGRPQRSRCQAAGSSGIRTDVCAIFVRRAEISWPRQHLAQQLHWISQMRKDALNDRGLHGADKPSPTARERRRDVAAVRELLGFLGRPGTLGAIKQK